MPAQQKQVRTKAREWTLLNTEGAISAISFAVANGIVEIRGTNTAAPPANTDRGWPYQMHMGELQKDLTALFYTAGIGYVWARSVVSNGVVIVDYA